MLKAFAWGGARIYGQVARKSSRPKSCRPETRVMSPEIYSHVARYFESCRTKFVLHMHRTPCLHGWSRGFDALNSCPHSWILESSSNDDGEKAIGFKMGRTTTLHVHRTFLYISFPFLHDYDVKMPHFAFYGGRKQATTKFFSLSELEYCPLKFSFRRVRLQLTK